VVLSVLFATACATYPGNYALSFDGLDDFVTVPHSYQDDLLSDFWTLEAWFLPEVEQSAWQLNIVGFPQRHPNMNYCGQGNPQCQPGMPLVQLKSQGANGNWFPVFGTAEKASPNNWHHIAGTWDNHTLSIFLDGVLDGAIYPYQQGYSEAQTCLKSPLYSCDAGLQIGGNFFRIDTGFFSGQYFRGYIDEVRVWTFARTQQEIQASMRTGLIGSEPGLLYYWRFDDYGKQITKSSAYDIYALLGGGNKDAEPKFVMSTAPLSAPPGSSGSLNSGGGSSSGQQVVVVHNGGAVTAGALIGVFCLLGGIAFGVFIGWKSYGKRLFASFWNSNQGEVAPLIK